MLSKEETTWMFLLMVCLCSKDNMVDDEFMENFKKLMGDDAVTEELNQIELEAKELD